MRIFILAALFSTAVFGQCGLTVPNPFTGLTDCIGPAATGTVTSIGLAGTANQITVTGATPITGSGSWTLSLPAAVTFPGDATVTGTLSVGTSSLNATTLAAVPSGSLFYMNGTAFDGVPTSKVRSTGVVEFEPSISTPLGGFGVFQNMLQSSHCFDCSPWSATNVNVPGATMTLPNGFVATGGDTDLQSTSANGHIDQCYDTTSALTGRTFGLSLYVRVPVTPVTMRLKIISNTPTTAVSTTFSATTTWTRVFTSGTFGVDAGTQACAQIYPVDGGTGLIYAWNAQLEEPTTKFPDMPALPTPTANSEFQPQRVLAFRSDIQEFSTPYGFSIGPGNNLNTATHAFLLGEDLTATSGGFVAVGASLTVSGALSMAFGLGASSSSLLENDIDQSVCLGANSSGLASVGRCAVMLRPGDGTNPGITDINGTLNVSGSSFTFGGKTCTVVSTVLTCI